MPILNQRDYRRAKARIDQLKRAKTAKDLIDSVSNLSIEVAGKHREALKAEYERLVKEVREYEKLRGGQASEKIEAVDLGLLPIMARITRGLSQKQLAELLDVKEQQIQRYESERFSSINIARYRRILDILGVELEATFLSSGSDNQMADGPALELSMALIREIKRRGWVDFPEDEGKSTLATYVAEAARLKKTQSLRRKGSRDEVKYDDSALAVWESRVLKLAYSVALKQKNLFDIADISWLRELISLSVYEDGPRRSIPFLLERGIVVIIESHLPQTQLDGAAMLLSTGNPVVGLTLRYDRIDYFWFTLLHEIGHIFLHFNAGLENGFFDNLDAINVSDEIEREADAFARSTLISDELWKHAPVRFSKSTESIVNFANSQEIHPAIVAGRLRKERSDFSKFGHLLGQGQVRKLFDKPGVKGIDDVRH